MKPAYPASVDTFPTYADGDLVDAAVLNDIHLVVIALEAVIGKNGARGSSADVATRLDAGMNSDGRFKNEILSHPGLAWMDEYPGGNSSETDGAYWGSSGTLDQNQFVSGSYSTCSSNNYASVADEEQGDDVETEYCVFHHATPEGEDSDMPIVAFSTMDRSGSAPHLFVRYIQDWTPGLGNSADQFEYAPASFAPRINSYCNMRSAYTTSEFVSVAYFVMQLFPRKFSDPSKVWVTRPMYLS